MFYITQAQKIANSLVATLSPHCKIINIAGSVRREKQEVKDIEIVCSPKLITKGGSTLFEINDPQNMVHPDFDKAIKSIGNVVKGKPDGKMMQIETKHKIMLDLFMPDSFDYYRHYAIRTGSAEYAQKVIATGWNKIGWCGSDKGLRKQSDCIGNKNHYSQKIEWKCINPDAEKPPIWESEEDFFFWLKIRYTLPKYR